MFPALKEGAGTADRPPQDPKPHHPHGVGSTERDGPARTGAWLFPGPAAPPRLETQSAHQGGRESTLSATKSHSLLCATVLQHREAALGPLALRSTSLRCAQARELVKTQPDSEGPGAWLCISIQLLGGATEPPFMHAHRGAKEKAPGEYSHSPGASQGAPCPPHNVCMCARAHSQRFTMLAYTRMHGHTPTRTRGATLPAAAPPSARSVCVSTGTW